MLRVAQFDKVLILRIWHDALSCLVVQREELVTLERHTNFRCIDSEIRILIWSCVKTVYWRSTIIQNRLQYCLNSEVSVWKQSESISETAIRTAESWNHAKFKIVEEQIIHRLGIHSSSVESSKKLIHSAQGARNHASTAHAQLLLLQASLTSSGGVLSFFFFHRRVATIIRRTVRSYLFHCRFP